MPLNAVRNGVEKAAAMVRSVFSAPGGSRLAPKTSPTYERTGSHLVFCPLVVCEKSAGSGSSGAQKMGYNTPENGMQLRPEKSDLPETKYPIFLKSHVTQRVRVVQALR